MKRLIEWPHACLRYRALLRECSARYTTRFFIVREHDDNHE